MVLRPDRGRSEPACQFPPVGPGVAGGPDDLVDREPGAEDKLLETAGVEAEEEVPEPVALAPRERLRPEEPLGLRVVRALAEPGKMVLSDEWSR